MVGRAQGGAQDRFELVTVGHGRDKRFGGARAARQQKVECLRVWRGHGVVLLVWVLVMSGRWGAISTGTRTSGEMVGHFGNQISGEGIKAGVWLTDRQGVGHGIGG